MTLLERLLAWKEKSCRFWSIESKPRLQWTYFAWTSSKSSKASHHFGCFIGDASSRESAVNEMEICNLLACLEVTADCLPGQTSCRAVYWLATRATQSLALLLTWPVVMGYRSDILEGGAVSLEGAARRRRRRRDSNDLKDPVRSRRSRKPPFTDHQSYSLRYINIRAESILLKRLSKTTATSQWICSWRGTVPVGCGVGWKSIIAKRFVTFSLRMG